MKSFFVLAFLITIANNVALAKIVGKSIRGIEAKETFFTLREACGDNDSCSQSGAGRQRVRSLGPIYVECSIATADAAGNLTTAPAESFKCTFNR